MSDKRSYTVYRLALLLDGLETWLTEIPLIKDERLCTIDEVIILAYKILLSRTRLIPKQS